LQERGNLSVTGVRRVLHCDETSAALETGDGTLHLVGAQLSVTALDLDVGEASLSGRIDALEYTENRTPGGLLHRLLR
jgi:sporulation protein YabP